MMENPINDTKDVRSENQCVKIRIIFSYFFIPRSSPAFSAPLIPGYACTSAHFHQFRSCGRKSEARGTSSCCSHLNSLYAIMSPKLSMIPDDMWVNVVWMPHSSLSHTSHVTIAVRSCHVTRERLKESVEWRVQVSVHGIGGLDLVPVSSTTPAAALLPRQIPLVRPTVATSTHECVWNHVLQAPIRWRDLPRDAYLQLEIIGQSDQKVST